MSAEAVSKTLGEERVRVTFNPSKHSFVDDIKQRGAVLINEIEALQPDPSWSKFKTGEFIRLKSLALTNIELGTMWAVKASTI